MTQNLQQLPSDVTRHRVLDTEEAAAFCRFSVPHWRRLYRNGATPAPVRLSTRKYGWRIGDLVDWIDESRRTQVLRRRPAAQLKAEGPT